VSHIANTLLEPHSDDGGGRVFFGLILLLPDALFDFIISVKG
jgi:hypothetical protein